MTKVSEWTILKFPDPRLREVSKPVEVFDDELREKVDRLFELMREQRGVGLAAAQVGWLERVFVACCGYDPEEVKRIDANTEGAHVFINPEITVHSDESVVDSEGCLSFPKIYAQIKRSAKVMVRAQNLAGEFFQLEAEDLLSRCIQHELDHLNGDLLPDRMPKDERTKYKKALRDMEKEFKGNL
ncbi:MAG: peptide deformylase [Planctomycetes bacterium]|nr:peptide deformylase [Planctomycetota bacterium]